MKVFFTQYFCYNSSYADVAIRAHTPKEEKSECFFFCASQFLGRREEYFLMEEIRAKMDGMWYRPEDAWRLTYEDRERIRRVSLEDVEVRIDVKKQESKIRNGFSLLNPERISTSHFGFC